MAFPLTGLVSYWKLDEASGTRADSHGTNHLTPTNAPVGAAGKIGNGCDFESSSSQYLSHSDPVPLGDEDYTYTCWFKRESLGVQQALIAKDNASTYQLLVDSDGTIAFQVGGGVIGNVYVIGAAANTNWHFLVAAHNAAANTVSIQMDNGTVTSTPTSGPAPSSAGLVRIGVGATNYFDGIIDEVGLWRRVLTAQERTDLYNGGAGLTYSAAPAALGAGDKTTLWSKWMASTQNWNNEEHAAALGAWPPKDLTTELQKFIGQG